MRILQLLFLTTLLGLPDVVLAQQPVPKIIVVGAIDDHTWMGHYSREILKSMKLTYKTPAIFQEADGSECFQDYPKLEAMITCVGHLLHSQDGQFIAFIQIYKPFTRQDSIDMKKLFPGGKHDVVDKQHISTIRRDIKESLGKKAELSWKQYVTYYPEKDAKRKFNADTAISVPIQLDSRNYYKNKYNHLEALYLQKQGRGFVNFYCFYTDEVKKNPRLYKKYMKAIEGIFRYED